MYDHPYTPPPTQYAPGPYIPPPTPHKAPKRHGVLVVAVVSSAAALMVGVGVGAASTGSTTTHATSTDTQTVEVTPQACLDALAASERMMHRAVLPTLDAAADALDSVAILDVAGIDASDRPDRTDQRPGQSVRQRL